MNNANTESSEQRFTLRAAAYLLLIKDNKILLSRRFNTGWRNGEYSLIAGHLDPGESIRTTMVREAKEEAGITIDKDDLVFTHVMQQYENEKYFDFYFTSKKWEGEPTNCELNKCDDMRWFPLNDLPDNLVPNVKQAIESYENGQYYSELGVE
jgi:8-oxo-dGTP pyrophosphatase MutT (NUDIX family)